MQLVETQLRGAAAARRGDVIGELEAAVAADPYQEGLWELLITALYRAGRQADALAAYQRVRARLGGRARARARTAAAGSSSGRSSTTTRRSAAPTRRRPGTCRRCRPSSSAATTEIAALVRPARRASGSSRSSGRAASARPPSRSRPAARWPAPGGVWLARLEAATTADDVLDTRDRRAGRHRRRGGAARAAQARRRGGDPRQLRARRRRRRGARGPPPRRRPRRCGSCARARSPLDVDGEAVFELAPLALADAVELFTRRAPPGAATAGDAVHELCRSLDGLPLAIELAAARTQDAVDRGDRAAASTTASAC